MSDPFIDKVATGLVCVCNRLLKIDEVQSREFMHQWSVRCTPAFDLEVNDYNANRIYSMEQPYNPCGFFKKAGLCEGLQCCICAGRNMDCAKAYPRKNKMRKHHCKGVKVSERKRQAYKDPILKILERIKRQFPIRWRVLKSRRGKTKSHG